MTDSPHNPQAANLFRTRYGNSPNVMTPSIWALRMIAKGHLAVELSSGAGIGREHQHDNASLWGVTVLIAADVHQRHDLSRSFSTRHEAETYIETLRAWRPTEGDRS